MFGNSKLTLIQKNKTMDKYREVIDELIKFRNERDWEQFHDSKNLALAISLEAAELNELFLWKKGNDVENIKLDRLKEELADILSFSFLLAEKHNLDIYEIVLDKIKSNNEKYPVDKAKGTAKKYNEL
jgi:NTP pyrophosphatase (non-canonical NTP hydrolase)